MMANQLIGGSQLREAAGGLLRCCVAIRHISTTHLFLIPAGLIAFYLLFFVPQVYHIWAPPRITSIAGAIYWALLAALAFIYITTLVRFVLPGYQYGRLFKPAGLINSWFVYLTRQLHAVAGSKGLLAAAVLLFVSGVAGLGVFDITDNYPYLMFGAFMQTGSLWLIGAGAWLFVATRLPDDLLFNNSVSNRNHQVLSGYGSEQRRGQGAVNAWQACGEAMSWVGALGCLVEVFWWTASVDFPLSSYRMYTVSSLIHFCILLVVIAALIDYVQNVSVIPARFLALFAAVVLLLTAGGNLIEDEPAVLPATAPGSQPLADNDWLKSFEARIDNIPPGPIIFVALSGGGSRAAIFSSHILKLMEKEKMPELPEAGDPAKVSSGESLWSDHIALISSVSGGSLAAARYVYDNSVDDYIDTLRYTDGEELASDAIVALELLLERGSDKEGNNDADSPTARQISKDINDAITALKNVLAGATGETNQGTINDLIDIVLKSRFPDDMSMDFMAPVLRGFTTPRASRGEGLYHFWNHQFNWSGISQQYAGEAGYDAGLKPLIFLNGTDSDYGRRVILGQPPLPDGLLSDAFESSDVVIETNLSRASDYMPRSLNDITAMSPDLSLARSVRVSSNFPFGFRTNVFSAQSMPALTFKVQKHEREERTELRLLDGGIVDNSGLDSLHALVTALAIHATRDPSGAHAALLNKVRARGVFIVEVDSGAKPALSGRPASMEAILSPLGALGHANFVNSLRSNDRVLIELANTLVLPPDAVSAQPDTDTLPKMPGSTGSSPGVSHLLRMPPGVPHFRFESNQLNDIESAVMTSFALGTMDKAKVLSLFMLEAMKWRRDYPDILGDYKNTVKTTSMYPQLPAALSESFTGQQDQRRQRKLQRDLYFKR